VRDTTRDPLLVDRFLAVGCNSGLACARSQQFNDVAFTFNPYLAYNWQFAPQWAARIEGDFGWANQRSTIYGVSFHDHIFRAGIDYALSPAVVAKY
jgi:hypothetical protein